MFYHSQLMNHLKKVGERKKKKKWVAYSSILANNRKRKRPGDSIFFHPSEDQIFAQYRKPTAEKDLDFDCSNLNLMRMTLTVKVTVNLTKNR